MGKRRSRVAVLALRARQTSTTPAGQLTREPGVRTVATRPSLGTAMINAALRSVLSAAGERHRGMAL